MKTKIGIIGGGNMGGAIIAGISKKYAVSVCEQDRKRSRWLKRKYKVTAGDFEAVVKNAQVIILAVKPQNFDSVLSALRPHITKDQLIISIAAGITCRYIERRLGAKTRVVRTMPNLPAQVGQGITGICPGQIAARHDLILACRIFNYIGKSIVVEEKWMDAITAVSGSGPAYVFLFIEYLSKAAEALGLEKKLSNELVRQTIKGSLDLFEHQKEEAGVLRERVTSKGGTTQAAMDVFKKHNVEKIFQAALKAAKKRAKELSK
jgi:pyrroline-5-carboxylate reductase